MTGRIILWAILAMAFILPPPAAALDTAAAKPTSASAKKQAVVRLTRIKVEFKVEAITKESFYMGEVWASPPRFTGIQAGKKFEVSARAWGLDAVGQPHKIEPTWTTSDRSLMLVSPNQGQRVKLTVLKAGQGELLVTAGDLSKRLKVKAAYHDDALQVEITQ